jgi:hypothetical protein
MSLVAISTALDTEQVYRAAVKPVAEQLIARYVQPYYMKMMRFNALENGEHLAADIASIAAIAAPADIVGLLQSSWRERVMGAWLSIATSDDGVDAAVLEALESSQGSLDSPPLITAAVMVSGVGAMPALTAYSQADLSNGWGAADVAGAAAHHLRNEFGIESALERPPPDVAEAFDGLLAIGSLIRVSRDP